MTIDNSMWKNPYRDLGNVYENSVLSIKFDTKDSESLSPIIKVEASCGCTDIKYDNNFKNVSANIKVGELPIHLKDSYSLNTKYITVYFADGKMSKLEIRYKLIKK